MRPAELLVARLPGQRDAARQAAALAVTAHRPWPLPSGPWLMGQTWRDLLFAHWPLEPERLRAVLPPQVEPDVIDGSAWLAVTPFEVTGLRLHGTPAPPLLSRFPETNVRTYVTVGGKPGIWFLSLDAASRLAVAAARRAYRLPYFHAVMAIARDGGRVDYASRRVSSDGPPAELGIRYGPDGPAAPAAPGTLVHAVTERYCLYTLAGRRLLRAEIHHPPWPLQPARAEVARLTMAEPYGITLAPDPPLLHYAARQDVVIWPPRACG